MPLMQFNTENLQTRISYEVLKQELHSKGCEFLG